MLRTLLFAGLLCTCVTAYNQNTIGVPNIVNYSKEVYHAGSQNWNIAQDRNGIMYFANNKGLLSFDGTFWRTYQLPNKTIVRSLAIMGDTIFVGGQAEIGYFSPGADGELAYSSLSPLLPPNSNDFTDVWNTCVFNNHVFFRANKRILAFDGKKFTIYSSINWSFMGTTPSELLAFEYERGLVSFKNGKWVPSATPGILPQDILIRRPVIIGRDSTLLPSLVHGLFILHHDTITRFETPSIAAIASKNIFGACLLPGDKIALITNLGGCIVINKKGEFIERLSKKEGIQNNNILSAMLDRDNNLWLGLDNGIDLITYNNAIKNVFPDQEDRNSGYASMIYNNDLYMAISTGLYKVSLAGAGSDVSYTTGRFELVENSNGQVWNLSEVNGKLLMGHNKGAFLIENNKAIPVDTKTGFWAFQPLYNTTPSSVIIAGTYNGINFYNYENGVISNPRVHAQFESARFVVINKDVIWVAHPYKGLYKITFNESRSPVASLYKDVNGILSSNHNKIFKVLDKVILTSDNGTFEYSEEKKDFVRSAFFEKILGAAPVSYIKDDKYGNIWFCRDKRVGVIDRSGAAAKTILISELDDRVMGNGFENINIIDSNNVFIAGEKGFFHINYAQYRKNKTPLRVLIRNVQSPTLKNILIFGGHPVAAEAPSIEHKGNSLHFEFSSTLYGQEENTQYSFHLKGFDKEWSPWAKKREKDYTNLPAGNYVFQVKCRNNVDNESAIATYSFKILPPWYQTYWAYAIYFLLFVGILYLFYKRQQRKYKKQQLLRLQEQQKKYLEEQQRLQYSHQLEMERTEKEIVQLKNEKLQGEIEQKNLEEEQKRLQFLHQIEAEKKEKEIIHLNNTKLQMELEHKNSELASSAMNLVQKSELLTRIKEELHRLKNNVNIEKDSKDFNRMIRVIDKELDHNKEWEQFAVHFDSVHTNYLHNLKEKYPDLTLSELKLCAYLRLGLSTKEIAQLMNISLRGVETSRYRLRKKLELANETNLQEFLVTFKG
jgi:DNA-binding CsgD family transcriptional regulator